LQVLQLDHKYRFWFTLDEKEADKLHEKLTAQAKKIAKKFREDYENNR